jgi:hypothetical protein
VFEPDLADDALTGGEVDDVHGAMLGHGSVNLRSMKFGKKFIPFLHCYTSTLITF